MLAVPPSSALSFAVAPLSDAPRPIAIVVAALAMLIFFGRVFRHPLVRPRAVLLAIVGVIGAMTVLGWALFALGLTS